MANTTTYDHAGQLFRQLCGTEQDLVTERQVSEAIRACEEASVPHVHIYQYMMGSGGCVVRRMFVFTKRTDLRQYLWYVNRHCELTASQPDMQSVPDVKWDPDAMWFADPFYEWGAMFSDDLYSHARRNGWIEDAAPEKA